MTIAIIILSYLLVSTWASFIFCLVVRGEIIEGKEIMYVFFITLMSVPIYLLVEIIGSKIYKKFHKKA